MVSEPDAASFLDPLLFCLGYLLVAVGLMLSQTLRDEGVMLHVRIGLLFNLLRKMSALAVLVGLALGFWAVGVWWLLWVPILLGSSVMSFQLLRRGGNRVAITMTLMALGLLLVSWALGPTLR